MANSQKVVDVPDIGVVAFPGDMEDTHVANYIKIARAKKKFSPLQTEESEHARQLKPAQIVSPFQPSQPVIPQRFSTRFAGKTTEESEKARQLKPAQPLSTAIPHLPQWANTPVLSGLTFDAQIERAEKSGHPEQAEWLRKQKSLQDKAYEKNKAKHPIATGIGTGVGEFAEGMTSPANLALIAGAPESKLLSGLFAIQALNGSYKDAGAARDAYLKGNNAEAAKYATEAALGLGIAGLAGHHAVKDIPVPEPVRKFVADETGSVTNPLAPKIPDVKAKAAELKPTTAYKSADESQPFYLKSENLINEKMKGPMPAEDVHKMLLSNGVKPEEMKWTGLDDFLWQNWDKKVTPQQIQEHLAGNNFQIREVPKGMPSTITPRETGELNQLDAKLDSGGTLTDAEHTRYIELNRKASSDDNTKYGSYVLPGGDEGSYRELLVTMPENGGNVTRNAKIAELVTERRKAIDALQEARQRFDEGTGTEEEIKKASARVAKAEKDAADLRRDNHNSTFRSSHWDELNPLGHVRFNDRTGPNGEKILHLEELQSDAHQAGRTQGYRLSSRETAPMDSEYRALVHKNADARARGESPDPKDVARAKELEDALIKADKSKVPDLPFKKTWPDLLLKRMVRYAAEHGYDGISWTPGEDQNARYSLSKQVDEIAVPMVNADGSRSVRIDPIGGGNNSFKLMVSPDGTVNGYQSASQFTGKKLDEVIGKDMAKKIMETKEPTSFSGEGLEVGGSGMKGFYDKIIPDAANKLGKQWGAKVGEIKIPTSEIKAQGTRIKLLGKLEQKTVPYLPITPQMRAGVKSIPYSLFTIPLAAGALTLAQVKAKAQELQDKQKKTGVTQ